MFRWLVGRGLIIEKVMMMRRMLWLFAVGFKKRVKKIAVNSSSPKRTNRGGKDGIRRCEKLCVHRWDCLKVTHVTAVFHTCLAHPARVLFIEALRAQSYCCYRVKAIYTAATTGWGAITMATGAGAPVTTTTVWLTGPPGA